MMATQKTANVVKLDAGVTSAPDRERVQMIRDWHRAQAHAERLPVALLNLAITSCGKVHTSGLAIEPEHALIMLGELETLALTLRSYVEARQAALPGSGEIVRFSRRA